MVVDGWRCNTNGRGVEGCDLLALLAGQRYLSLFVVCYFYYYNGETPGSMTPLLFESTFEMITKLHCNHAEVLEIFLYIF